MLEFSGCGCVQASGQPQELPLRDNAACLGRWTFRIAPMENRMALARVRQDVVLHRYYGTGLSSEMGRDKLSVGGVG